MTRSFTASFDYRCPFARNLHVGILAGLAEGRDWQVTFTPFSQDQSHVEDGEPPVWEQGPEAWGTGVLPLCWGLAVRDTVPDRFLGWHAAAFAARHEQARRIADPAVLAEVAESVGLDSAAVATEVATGRPLATLAREHTEAVRRLAMFGVPTLVVGERAAFVRMMAPPTPDDVERLVDLFTWAELNEFKHTTVPR
ncbi:MAG: DsbA family protein [Actinomycetota bacterium]